MIFYFFLVSLIVQVIFFIPAFFLKSDKLTDFSYALTFIILAFLAFLLSQDTWSQRVLLVMIIVWAIRLGTYLVVRIRSIGKDKRFDNVRENYFKFLIFWVVQGVVAPLVLVPAFLFFLYSQGERGLLGGIFIWLVGLLIETLADIQKYTFYKDSKNETSFLATGLWKYSRHPNYLGEILCWIGVYVFTFTGLVGGNRLIGIIGPATIIILILFFSGIPPLEKSADKKWGKNSQYLAYKRRTALLIPFVF